jgi:hypothetical protein
MIGHPACMLGAAGGHEYQALTGAALALEELDDLEIEGQTGWIREPMLGKLPLEM